MSFELELECHQKGLSKPSKIRTGCITPMLTEAEMTRIEAAHQESRRINDVQAALKSWEDVYGKLSADSLLFILNKYVDSVSYNHPTNRVTKC